jgi:hypothetical protein
VAKSVECDGPDLEQNPVVERLLAAENVAQQTAYFMGNRHPSELPSRKSPRLLPSPGNAANSFRRWFPTMHPIQTRTIGRAILLLALACSFVSVASAEWKERVLYSFQGDRDGASPTVQWY